MENNNSRLGGADCEVHALAEPMHAIDDLLLLDLLVQLLQLLLFLRLFAVCFHKVLILLLKVLLLGVHGYHWSMKCSS